MSRKDGGPAFPGGYEGVNESGEEVRTGMSLRDWFAGMAMQAIIDKDRLFSDREAMPVSKRAYKIADAMIEEREREEERNDS